MEKITAADYLARMAPFLRKLPAFLRSAGAKLWYGPGTSAHWPIQSNCNVFAGLAVLGTAPEFDALSCSMSRDEVIATSLALLRFALDAHITGGGCATDGKPWGHHWISVLGLERMAHGVDAIRPFLAPEDEDGLRRMLLSESDWLLDHYPVEAGLDGYSGKNKPESNIWNGGVMLRCVLDYPDAPRCAEYLEKAAEFFANGISHALDAVSEVDFGGKVLRLRHRGCNFGANFALDHHAYLNIGYMVICLSNLAMLHFQYKERGVEPPPFLYHHMRELWEVVKHFTFADGRLLRIGGDTRARYTYCQCYAIPAWLAAADLWNDADAVAFEKRWLETVRLETEHNGDGAYYSRRLAQMERESYYYYTRLESDPFLCLSCGAYWRRRFAVPDVVETREENPAFVWSDAFHGAEIVRTGASIRSFVWRGAQGPTGLCVPAACSNLAEWQGNLHGSLVSFNNPGARVVEHRERRFPGGFITVGCCDWSERTPCGEGEAPSVYARHWIGCAALPDGESMLILEYASVRQEATLREIHGLGLKIPNDIFNGNSRIYRAGEMSLKLPSPDREEHIALPDGRGAVDGKLAVLRLYGGELSLVRRAVPAIRIEHAPTLHSLAVDEICLGFRAEPGRPRPGEVLLDCGAAVVCGDCCGELVKFDRDGLKRSVDYRAGNGVLYRFSVDFSDLGMTLDEE